MVGSTDLEFLAFLSGDYSLNEYLLTLLNSLAAENLIKMYEIIRIQDVFLFFNLEIRHLDSNVMR